MSSEINKTLNLKFPLSYFKLSNAARSKLDNIGVGGGGGGGADHIYIYLCSAQLISFEIDCFYGV